MLTLLLAGGILRGVPFRLNLAALTDEELQALLGREQALIRLPEISRARLAAKPAPGPEVHDLLEFENLSERAWGATPEQSRALSDLETALLAEQAQLVGSYYVPSYTEVRHLRALTIDPDTSALIRWSETPESARTAVPFLQLLTWVKDRASGIACVLTNNAAAPPAPAFSEEVDFQHFSGVPVSELLALHRQRVYRQGKTQKLSGDGAWMRSWQALHNLNLTAWARRGLLIKQQ